MDNYCTLGAYFSIDELSENLRQKIKDHNSGLTLTAENTLVYVRKENFGNGIGYDIMSDVYAAEGEPPESVGFYTTLKGDEQQEIDRLLVGKVRYSLEHIND